MKTQNNSFKELVALLLSFAGATLGLGLVATVILFLFK